MCIMAEVEKKSAEAEKRIKEAFGLFDTSNNNSVDVREIGTIIRSLGLNPTELQLRDTITKCEEDEPTGFIRLEKFQPVMVKIMMENEFARDSYDMIARAFQVFDPEGKGYVDLDELKREITSSAERFSDEEVETFLRAAADMETNRLYYEEYAQTLSDDR